MTPIALAHLWNAEYNVTTGYPDGQYQRIKRTTSQEKPNVDHRSKDSYMHHFIATEKKLRTEKKYRKKYRKKYSTKKLKELVV